MLARARRARRARTRSRRRSDAPTRRRGRARSAPATSTRRRPRCTAPATGDADTPGLARARRAEPLSDRRRRADRARPAPTRSSCSHPATTARSRGSTTTRRSRLLTVLRDRVRSPPRPRRGPTCRRAINHGRAAGASIEHPHAPDRAARLRAAGRRGRRLDRFEHAGDDLVDRPTATGAADGFAVLDGPGHGVVPGRREHARTSCASRTARPDAPLRRGDATTRSPSSPTRPGRCSAASPPSSATSPYNLVVHTAPPGTGRCSTGTSRCRPGWRSSPASSMGTGILVNTSRPSSRRGSCARPQARRPS